MVAHVFLLFVFDWMFETRPKSSLRRLTDADFFQQIGKNLQTRRGHMPELALVKIVNGLVERF
jgi:hypothetical protein